MTTFLVITLGFVSALCAKISPDLRIVGGLPASPGDYPFAAAILQRTSTGTYLCGGTILSEEWIVTTGTCLYMSIGFQVYLGCLDLYSPDPNRVILGVKQSILHENFNRTTLVNDIGLLQTSTPMQFNEFISPIYLATNDVPDYYPVVATGWGHNEQEPGTNELYFAEIYTIPNWECRNVYGNQITETMLCGAGVGTEGACKSDVGGTLIYYVNGRHATIAGISSFISQSACEKHPSGFTRVFQFNDWIRKNTNIL